MRTLAVLGIVAATLTTIAAAQGTTPTVAAIRASQLQVEREFRDSDRSPFTAVASRYFADNESAFLLLAAGQPSFAPNVGKDAVIEFQFDGRALWATPIPGPSRVTIRRPSGAGSRDTGQAERSLDGRTQLADQDLIVVGKYLVENGARPGTGRIVLYDAAADDRRAFTGLHWFPVDMAFQVKARFVPIDHPDAVIVGTSRGLQKEYYRVGRLEFQVAGTPQRLVALATSATPREGDELFVPFRDATTGKESYAVGRYLNLQYRSGSIDYLLDFNLATNPYCAYSPHFNCVIPPRENTLTAAIRAGEQVYRVHGSEGK